MKKQVNWKLKEVKINLVHQPYLWIKIVTMTFERINRQDVRVRPVLDATSKDYKSRTQFIHYYQRCSRPRFYCFLQCNERKKTVTVLPWLSNMGQMRAPTELNWGDMGEKYFGTIFLQLHCSFNLNRNFTNAKKY